MLVSGLVTQDEAMGHLGVEPPRSNPSEIEVISELRALGVRGRSDAKETTLESTVQAAFDTPC